MTRKEVFIVFPVLIGMLWLLTHSANFAPYNIEDDCHYVKIAHPELVYFESFEDPSAYKSFSDFFVTYNFSAGRFRPLSLCFFWLIGNTAGDNYAVKGFWMLLISSVVTLLFYALLRQLEVGTLIAVMFTVVFITGKYDEIFYRRTGEIVGLFFLLSGTLLYLYSVSDSKSHLRIPAFVLLVCSALSKEPFLVLFPITVSVLMYYSKVKEKISWRELLIRFRFSLLIGSIIYVLALIALLYAMSTSTGYALRVSSFNSDRWIQNLIRFFGNPLIWAPVFASFIFVRLAEIKKLLPVIALLLLWVLSQSVVYVKSDVSYCRYLMPAGLLPLIIGALAVSSFQDFKLKKLQLILLFLVACVGIAGAKNVLINSSYFEARAKAYHEMIEYVALHHCQSKIEFIKEQGGIYDFFESSIVFLSRLNCNPNFEIIEVRKDGNARTYAMNNLAEYGMLKLSTGWSSYEQVVSTLHRDTLAKTIIVTVPSPTAWFDYDKLKTSEWEPRHFYQKYWNMSVSEFIQGKMNSYDTLSFTVLTRNTN